MDLIERDGFWWPQDDDWCWRVIHGELPDLDVAIGLARNRSAAVQAGGNVGVWASHLAEHFGTVVTVEPDADNYECLTRNVPPNVIHSRAGLGERIGSVGMSTVTGNAGAHFMNGNGDIPIVTVDSFDLDACDLLCLDIEGGEPQALRGAERTIREFRPVIMFEEKGLSERYYNIPRGTAERWILGLGLGYRLATKLRADVILTC